MIHVAEKFFVKKTHQNKKKLRQENRNKHTWPRLTGLYSATNLPLRTLSGKENKFFWQNPKKKKKILRGYGFNRIMGLLIYQIQSLSHIFFKELSGIKEQNKRTFHSIFGRLRLSRISRNLRLYSPKKLAQRSSFSIK